MKLSGSYKLNVKKEVAWKALNDSKILKMCEDCRVGAMFEENNKMLDVGERPKPRTTDDYLN